jgi:hypothetical protein
VNAQYPITTTPKYNFPLPNENLQLPQQFIELSLRSLKIKQHRQPPFPNKNTTPYSTAECLEHFFPTTSLTKLKPNPAKTPIVAIDVSSIKLGETEAGTLLAIRGAIVWKQTNRYRYLRLGPFPFHITEKNKNEICSLRQHHQTAHVQEYTSPNTLYVQTRLTTLLERWIQASVNRTTHGSLILWDGSLTAGTPETPVKAMEQLLKEARDDQNTILAFSKMTRLLFYDYRLTDLILEYPPPCLLKIINYPTCIGSMHLMGNIYVAKLTGGSYTFRLDADKRLSNTHVVEAVQKLLGNDLILQSYPETLRLAHIFSTFTATEVLGIQRCIAKENNIKIVTRPSIRRILFGRFGKGPEG